LSHQVYAIKVPTFAISVLYSAGFNARINYAMPFVQTSIRFEGVHCSIVLERLTGDVIRLGISGTDTGELGDAPMQALHDWLASSEPVKLFIDARAVRGASIDVSNEWAVWLSESKLLSVDHYADRIEARSDHCRICAAICGIKWSYVGLHRTCRVRPRD